MKDKAQGEAAVARAKTGDRHAVQYLYTTHYSTVLRYADSLVHDRETAEDVAQTTFLKLLTKIHLYEPRAVPFEAWLLRVTRNVALDELRRRKSRSCSELLEHDQVTVDAVADRFDTFHAALDRMPAPEREVLVLRHVVGLSWEEIADRMESTEPMVRTLHERGRHGLKRVLRRSDGHHPVRPAFSTPRTRSVVRPTVEAVA